MSRNNLQIKVGTYIGTGSAHEITGIGFAPDLVLVKGGGNDAVFRIRGMLATQSSYLSRATSDVTNGITQLGADGFYVGAGVTANESATAYHYLAIRGVSAQNYFRCGKFLGDGNDNRNFVTGGLGFTPDIVFIKHVGAQGGYYRTSDIVGDPCMRIDATGGLTGNVLQNLQSNGFQLGITSAANELNQIIRFIAMKKIPGVIATFTYVGDGNDNRSIAELGFTPDFVLISANGSYDSIIRTSSMVGDTSGFTRNTAFAANHVQALETNGFQLGNSDNVNKSGVTYYGIAIKAGNFNAPITRLST